MLIVTFILFLIICFINYKEHERFLAPPVIFSSVWMLCLFGLIASGDFFYQIGWETLAVYTIGLLAFTMGGFVANALFPTLFSNMKRASYDHVRVNRILNTVLIIITVLAPLYFVKLINEAGSVDWALLLAAIRYEDVQKSGEATQFSFLNNLPLIASFTATAIFNEELDGFGPRWRTLFALVLAMIFGISTGSKAGLVVLPLTIFFIACVKSNQIRWRIGLVIVMFVILAFALGLAYINYAFASNISANDMIRTLFQTMQNYWLGGLIAFDYVVKEPSSIDSVQNIFRNFIALVNSVYKTIGIPYKESIASIHASYVDISPTQNTNTYTIYFSYFKDIGWIGMTFILTCLATFVTTIYKIATFNNPLAIQFYAVFAVGLVLSFHSEHFFLGINQYVKAAIFYYLLYFGFILGRKGSPT